jgi:heme oxygenase
MDITQRLRSAIAPAHERTECLPVAQAMARGIITPASYRVLLCQLGALHATVEPLLADRLELAGLFTPAMARSETIARDLAFLGGSDAPCLNATDALIARIRAWGNDPWRLLGALYVFEGSRMGSMVLVGPLAAALAVRPEPGQGVDYHLDGIGERPLRWREFKARLASLPLDEASQDAVVEGAVLTMEGLAEVFAAISPSSPEPLAPSPEFVLQGAGR